MTPLQQRMIDDLQLKGMSVRTQQMYVRAVRQLAEHYRKPPDQTTDAELRQYFLYVKNVKHWSRAGTAVALCGMKFFYQHTRQRQSNAPAVHPPPDKKLPVVFSREEVDRSFLKSGCFAIGLASPRSTPADCASRKALTSKSATWIAPAG